ncbi:MAG: hypothetical protein M1820_007633 [Bogoriella megaspora]|nr:MAG: hypothetical protein M1820_007633 [Bogoriella megaspora]
MASLSTNSEAGANIYNGPDGQRHDRIQDDVRSLDQRNGVTDVSITQKMLSAVSGSIFTSLLVTPLDVVRVRLQSQSSPSSFPNNPQISLSPSPQSFRNLPQNLGTTTCCREEVFWLANNSRLCLADSTPSPTRFVPVNTVPRMELTDPCAAEEVRKRTFTSTIDGLRKIARNEGLLTLWRGLSATLIMSVPGNVIYFAGYDWLRVSPASPFNTHIRVPEAYAPLAAGSVARVVAAIAIGPVEMLRTRMQHSEGRRAGGVMRETIRGLGEMVGQEGWRSLWRGLTLTLWRDVPFSGLYWWGYEAGRDWLGEVRDKASGVGKGEGGLLPKRRRESFGQQNHSTVLLDSFIAGAASGGFAAFITTPFDVGKTRQQVVRYSQRASSMAGGEVPPERRSMPRFLLHIYRTEGTAGLFKGWAARCLKIAPACAIMISSYEIGKKMAGIMNEKAEAREAR